MSKTREAWLLEAVDALRPLFRQHDATIPPTQSIKVSMGWCKGKGVGQVWAPETSADETTHHIFISPCRGDEVQILGILVHELVHVVVGHECKHGGDFAVLARTLGLAGKLTATFVGEGSKLYAALEAVASQLGVFPHIPLVPKAAGGKPPAGGWVKLVSAEQPKYILRISPNALELGGMPVDPWGREMVRAED